MSRPQIAFETAPAGTGLPPSRFAIEVKSAWPMPAPAPRPHGWVQRFLAACMNFVAGYYGGVGREWVFQPDRQFIGIEQCCSIQAFRNRPRTATQVRKAGQASAYITGPIRQGTNSWWPICSAQVRRPD